MAPPRLREAPQQSGRARLEVEHAAVEATALEALDVLGKRGQRSAARVDADRDALLSGVEREEVGNLSEQRRWQIVDAVVAGVLEHLEGDALARAGQPADDDEARGQGSPFSISWL